ncbi:MAG: hypothetical protein WB699_11640 [Bacteroidota bacterium]
MIETPHFGSSEPRQGGQTVDSLLQSILDLTLAMEKNTDAEDYQKITELMGHRDHLVEEVAKLRQAAGLQAGTELLKAIDRENTILMAQLQQKRDLITTRLQEVGKERAIAHYRK